MVTWKVFTQKITLVDELTEASTRLPATRIEVSRVVNQPNEDINTTSRNIKDVTVASGETGKGASQTQDSARERNQIENSLKTLVEQTKV
jgi:methyl-accepting chemotaxis protein